jgi:Arf-GAP/SH3 domain/ANK repeat/PH domain-containing protein
MTLGDDGPLFRATIKGLEQKTAAMRAYVKKMLKRAEAAYASRVDANLHFIAFMDSLKETSSTNQKAVQPAIDHYFKTIAREIQAYETQNAMNLRETIIEPLTKLYTADIKQADHKKREFDEESRDYYSFLARYLGQRHDSAKAKKLAESDSKYQAKRRKFELKRFDYWNFLQDLHGGRKELEMLSQLTKYATTQVSGYLSAAKTVDGFLPQLEALSTEVQEASKQYQYQRREREEKRRHIEKSAIRYIEPETPPVPSVPGSSNGPPAQDGDLGRLDSTASQTKGGSFSYFSATAIQGDGGLSRSPGSLQAIVGTPSQFKGYLELEERDQSRASGPVEKEGLLWALSRPPGLHVDPRAIKQWHK